MKLLSLPSKAWAEEPAWLARPPRGDHTARLGTLTARLGEELAKLGVHTWTYAVTLGWRGRVTRVRIRSLSPSRCGFLDGFRKRGTWSKVGGCVQVQVCDVRSRGTWSKVGVCVGEKVGVYVDV